MLPLQVMVEEQSESKKLSFASSHFHSHNSLISFSNSVVMALMVYIKFRVLKMVGLITNMNGMYRFCRHNFKKHSAKY